ncbi:MAG: cation:dicarboxylase symporter family transporter, partial [Pseudomonadota bacterium]
MRKLALHWQILIAIVLAVVVGYSINVISSATHTPGLWGVSYVSMFDYIGTMFLNALKMIIVPLILSSIIVG